ncbi:hypothetical protein DXT99_10170 [Pontibacter diazotrophicus]|uniref:Uncharacterized protein n=1 Tax=Pontibacter diazotrophicus TaxID=1400979 RepID=A0A3D8LD95_9BACT|nr:hypothetical protein DXT99_10170 [Pontibacter diazotrophicus]
MKVNFTILNLVIPLIFIAILPFKIWGNIQAHQPDKVVVFIQSLLLLFAIAIFIYRLVKLKNAQ